MVQLRNYQEEIIAGVREFIRRGERKILIQSPTGSGKTATTACMVKGASDKGNRCWFVVHRRELVKQAAEAFSLEGIHHGFVAADRAIDSQQTVQICSVSTLRGRYKYLPVPRMIVWDEAHHLAAGTWSKIHAHYPDSIHIGLTATPQRLDGTGLDKWFDVMVEGPKVQWLIDQGFLADYKIYAPGGGIDMTGVEVGANDYHQGQMRKRVDRPSITGDAVQHYRKYAPGQRTIVFCASIEHSEHVAAAFTAAGIPAEHVDGMSRADYRDGAIERFRSGETMVLTNVELFGEGFDLPAASCALLMRPTKSLGLYLQQCGRVLRPAPGKEHAIILDHAGSCVHHGLPCDEFGWSLEGKVKRSRPTDAAPPVRICTTCFAALPGWKRECEYCGSKQPLTAREINELEGQLEEINKKKIRRQKKMEQAHCDTYEKLVQLGRDRGYPNPEFWARRIWDARVSKGRAG